MGQATKLVYFTSGWLLRFLRGSKDMRLGASVVRFVMPDELHERSVDTYLRLVAVGRLLVDARLVTVILASATLEQEHYCRALSNYAGSYNERHLDCERCTFSSAGIFAR